MLHLPRYLIPILLACCALFAREATAEKPSRPNFIFILADDLGWGDLGCYGHPHLKTPRLDQLAKQGTLFTQFYVNGSVCSPSRCAFFTGQYPARHRIHGHYATHEQNAARGMNHWLDPQAVNVAGLLRQAGYKTAHFGKWHLGSGQGAPAPAEYGFDATRTMNSNGPGWEEPDTTFRAKSSAAIVDEAIKFLAEHRQEPMYLQLWTLIPHATLNPTDEQMTPYVRFRAGGASFPHRSAAEIYYASVTDLDAQIGRLMDRLDELGLARNTLVFFSSDNGPEDIHVRNAGHSGIGSAGPFRGRKRSLYEGGIRVPGIVRWPDVIPAGRIDNTSVVAGVDWLPTVCQFAGVPMPEHVALDGEDLGDVFRGQPRPRKNPLMWEWRFRIAGEPFHQSPILAIREGDWKLLLNPDRSRVELFDLPRDPTQLENIAEDHPEVVERLGARLLAWQRSLPEGPRDPDAGSNASPGPHQKQ